MVLLWENTDFWCGEQRQPLGVDYGTESADKRAGLILDLYMHSEMRHQVYVINPEIGIIIPGFVVCSRIKDSPTHKYL